MKYFISILAVITAIFFFTRKSWLSALKKEMEVQDTDFNSTANPSSLNNPELEFLYKCVAKFRDTQTNRDLEEYLLALYKIVQENKDSIFTIQLAVNMLEKAFTAEPAEFKEEWLEITESPQTNAMSRKFTNPEIKDEIDKTRVRNISDYNYTLEVIKFQIAELHKMRGKQLEDEFKYFGITSETGHSWYNFDPIGNLECGTSCMLAHNENVANIDWTFIGDLLEDGRVYE